MFNPVFSFKHTSSSLNSVSFSADTVVDKNRAAIAVLHIITILISLVIVLLAVVVG